MPEMKANLQLKSKRPFIPICKPPYMVEEPTGNTIGQRIRSARKLKRLTQLDLAKSIGVKSQSVSQWENEHTVPEGRNLQKCARSLDVIERWLDTGKGRPFGDANRKDSSMETLPVRAGEIEIPLMSAIASMGLGFPVQEYETIIDGLRLSHEWCRRNLSVSNLQNLAALSAYGDSMRPTFDDGDILIVDRGVNNLKLDAVYVLQFRDELYVKRIQRRPDGVIVIRSDNALYEPTSIDPEKDGLRVLGRVVWVWNGRRL